MAALSEWLQIMLAEIAREEDAKRATEKSSDTAALHTNAAPPT
jgi:hypothetical protein